MIIEWLLGIGVAIAQWFVDLLPDWDVPPEITNFDGMVNDFFATFEGVGVWAPWPLVLACVAIALGSWVIGITVKTARAVASYLPFFGGSG